MSGGSLFSASVQVLASDATAEASIPVGRLIAYGAYVLRVLVCLKDWLGSKAYYQSVWIPTGLNADGAELFWSESLMTAQDAEGLWDAGVYPLSEDEYTEYSMQKKTFPKIMAEQKNCSQQAAANAFEALITEYEMPVGEGHS